MIGAVGEAKNFAKVARAATIAPGRPQWIRSVDRPAPTLDDPAGTSPYSHCAARPSAHLHPNRSSLDVSPHVPTPPSMACTIGPLTLSSFTATVLAHGPVLGPTLQHRRPSCPVAPRTGTSRTILHLGQCSTSPPQPGAALRLIARLSSGQLSCTLVYAALCTAALRARHRSSVCAPRLPGVALRG